jgi:hypothetical protein
VITPSALVSRREFEDGTGWMLKPEGACKGDVCIPLPFMPSEEVDIREIAEVIGLPLVRDDTHEIWSLGPESIGQRALVSASAPDLVLPDMEGNPFALSSLAGQKVVLLAWAPY